MCEKIIVLFPASDVVELSLKGCLLKQSGLRGVIDSLLLPKTSVPTPILEREHVIVSLMFFWQVVS